MPITLDSPSKLSASIGQSRWLKDLISLGTYTRPDKDWVLNVTPSRLSKWVDTFNLMKKNGVDVEVNADHSLKADDVVGYVDALRIENGELLGELRTTNDRGHSLAKTVKNVSIYIEPNCQDGKGNVYGEAITHVAIVQQPVVPNQREFIALSLVTQSGGEPANPQNPETDNMSPEELELIRTAMGNPELTASDAAAAAATSITDLNAKVTELQGAVAASKVKSDPTPKISQPVLEDLAESAEDQIDSLVSLGKVAPAVAEKLKLSLIGAKGKRVEMALSRTGDEQPALVKMVIDALKDSPVLVKPGAQTGAQTLNRVTPDGSDGETAVATKEQIESEVKRILGQS